MYRSASTALDVSPAVVTLTSTRPAACAGLVATIWVAVFETIVAAVLPKLTLVAAVRFDPLMVTCVPPAVLPLFGETCVTAGVAGAAGRRAEGATNV